LATRRRARSGGRSSTARAPCASSVAGTTCARIERVDEFSAHADRSELIDWPTASPTATQPPRRVFVVHGEAAASAALAEAVRARLPSEVIEARYGERVAIC
jgi:metallo-beta-lactamase family protein